MKKTNSVLLAVCCVVLFSVSTAMAGNSSKKSGAANSHSNAASSSSYQEEIPLHMSRAAAERSMASGGGSSNAGGGRLGLGLTTIDVAGSNSALSAWYDLSSVQSVQAFLAIPTTSPFLFGVGGAYRYTISGNHVIGFHVGGGMNLGTVANTTAPTAAQIAAGNTGSSTNFYVAFSPMAGFHFAVPGITQISASLDGGPQFMISGGNFRYATQGLSSALGLSVHYFL